jgi:hypothetical protein
MLVFICPGRQEKTSVVPQPARKAGCFLARKGVFYAVTQRKTV